MKISYTKTLLLFIACNIILSAKALNIPLLSKFLVKKAQHVPAQNQIGILKLTNQINNEETEKLIKKIIEFAEKDSIKGILLVINSNGGSSGLSELISREIEMLNKTKPIVTLVASMCNSGAYLVASATSNIIAPSMSTIGSIGVLWSNKKINNMKQKNSNGINGDIIYDTVHAGKYKIARNEDTPIMKDEVRAFYQEHVDNCYKNFVARVAQFRNLKIENVSDWADAKEFTGEQALQLGLIDQVGGYSDAVEKLKLLMRERGSYKDGKLHFVE
ncbi:MAG: signal peptide peptidase SppA [Candidatus Dependentiae bacterium]